MFETPQSPDEELLTAAQDGDHELAARALEAGASPDARDEDGSTPLIIAAQEGHVEIVRTLLEWGAQTDLKDAYGDTALILAAYEKHTEIVRLLLDWRADPNARNKKGHSALEWAAMNEGGFPILKLLLQRGADPNIQSADGITPMMWTLSKPEALRELIKHGADWRIRDRNNKHAFEWAIENCSHEGIEILKAMGATQYPEKKKR